MAHCLGMTYFKILNTFPVINDNITLNVFKRIPSTGGNHELDDAYNCTSIETVDVRSILKQKSLATQNLVDILFIIKIPVLKID